MLPNPTGMEMHDFIDACCCIMQAYPNMARLDGDDWQHWGMAISSSPQLGKFDIPNPMAYDDWHLWAQGLVTALQSATEAPGRGTH